jgi:prevent-host-death family protein
MTTAAVSKLKASLSRFLAKVKAGDEIIVTERGKPVARIVPYVCEDDPEMERLREMERAGLLRIGTGKLPKDFWKRPRPKDPEGLVLKALLEERENGR